MVAGPLERRQRQRRERFELVELKIISEIRSVPGCYESRQRLVRLVAGLLCTTRGSLGQSRPPLRRRRRLRACEVELEPDVEPERPGQVERPPEK